MPQNNLSVARLLADVVALEEGDVAADVLLRDVEQPRVAHEAQPERITLPPADKHRESI